MRPEEFLAEQDEPFIQKEFITKTQLTPEAAKTWLKNMVAEQAIGFRKIGRMNVYWPLKAKKIPEEVQKPSKGEIKEKKTKLTDYLEEEESPKEELPPREPKPTEELTKLHDRILALEEERDLLLNENRKIKHEFERFQARFADEEDVWREIAEKMASSLAEMRGVTIKEVLKYFGAPHY